MEPTTSTSEATPSQPKTPAPQSFLKSVLEFVKFVAIAAVIVIPVRMYIAQPFIVNGTSMDPTFATGQYLIIDEISYRFTEPKRGEVIVLHDPRGESTKYLIKRVIGLPGETLEITDGSICIRVEETCTALEEPYVLYPKKDDVLRVTLGTNEFFIMGDNRAASLDSRYFGPVKREQIVGRTFVRLLPPSTAALFPGTL